MYHHRIRWYNQCFRKKHPIFDDWYCVLSLTCLICLSFRVPGENRLGSGSWTMVSYERYGVYTCTYPEVNSFSYCLYVYYLIVCINTRSLKNYITWRVPQLKKDSNLVVDQSGKKIVHGGGVVIFFITALLATVVISLDLRLQWISWWDAILIPVVLCQILWMHPWKQLLSLGHFGV